MESIRSYYGVEVMMPGRPVKAYKTRPLVCCVLST